MESFIDEKYLIKHTIKLGSDEPVICSTFGCRKELTLPEQLAGNKCTGCMGTKETIFKHYKL